MAEPGPWRVPVLRRPVRAEEHRHPIEQVIRLRAERRPSDAPANEVLDDRAGLSPRAGLALEPPLVYRLRGDLVGETVFCPTKDYSTSSTAKRNIMTRRAYQSDLTFLSFIREVGVKVRSD